MKTIEALIPIKKLKISTDPITKPLGFLKNDWRLKRLTLNISWGLINLIFFVYSSLAIIGSSWEIIWFMVIIIYAGSYWILSAKIFDILIGDEIDFLKKNSFK